MQSTQSTHLWQKATDLSDFSLFLLENDFKALFPELFLITASIILLTGGVLVSTSLKYSRPILVTQSSLLGIYSLILCYLLICNNNLQLGYVFYNCLVMDNTTLFLKKVLIVVSIITISIAIEYNKSSQINQFELIVLLLLSTSSMLFMIQSADLISIYLAIELQSLCFYVMAAIKSNSPFSSEAGLKYFLLGAFSSGILLFGCSLVYGFTGVTEFVNLSKILSCGTPFVQSEMPLIPNLFPLRGCELGMIFILVAFLFKITAVPFHVWAPDVYEGAPTTVTAFFSLAPKIALLAVMMRIFGSTDYYFSLGWQNILIFSSLASMTLGTFAAMSQNKIKRLLAFSSIGHVGYMLVALSLDSLLGVQALCVYIVTYVVMTASLFAIFLCNLGASRPSFATLTSIGTSRTSQSDVSDVNDVSDSSDYGQDNRNNNIKYITDLTQLAITNPALAACLTVTLFSMAGIPPLAGFYAKANVFLAALSSEQYLLALVGVLTSVVSSYYYIRLVKIMYFEKSNKWLSFDALQKTSTIPLSICFFFSICFMIYPTPLYLASHMVSINAF